VYYFGSLAASTDTKSFVVQNVTDISWFVNALHVLCLSEGLWSYIVHRDGDGVPDGFDNCVDLPNGEQADVDNDTIGIKILTVKDILFCHESKVAILFQKANRVNG